MRDEVEEHVEGILKGLRSDTCNQTGSPGVAQWLRKYLENMSHKDLLSINAIMYAGRDQNPPRKIENYIDRCGVFAREELVQAMLVRLDDLQEYLNRGVALARLNFDFASERS